MWGHLPPHDLRFEADQFCVDEVVPHPKLSRIWQALFTSTEVSGVLACDLAACQHTRIYSWVVFWNQDKIIMWFGVFLETEVRDEI